MKKAGQIYRYTDSDPTLYMIADGDLFDCRYSMLVDLSTGAVCGIFDSYDSCTMEMELVAESINDMKPNLDTGLLKKFIKYFDGVSDDGVVSCDAKFCKYFPTQKQQAQAFMLRAIKEIVVVEAKKNIKENKEK